VAMKKVRIPLIGGVLAALFGDRAGYMPAFHIAASRLGTDPQGLPTGRDMFKGADVQAGYDTFQVFKEGYPHGSYSVLSPWHMKGRYLKAPPATFWERLFGARPASLPRPAITRPDEAFARVLALARKLPPKEALAVVARYSAVMQWRRDLGAGTR